MSRYFRQTPVDMGMLELEGPVSRSESYHLDAFQTLHDARSRLHICLTHPQWNLAFSSRRQHGLGFSITPERDFNAPRDEHDEVANPLTVALVMREIGLTTARIRHKLCNGKKRIPAIAEDPRQSPLGRVAAGIAHRAMELWNLHIGLPLTMADAAIIRAHANEIAKDTDILNLGESGYVRELDTLHRFCHMQFGLSYEVIHGYVAQEAAMERTGAGVARADLPTPRYLRAMRKETELLYGLQPE